MLQEDDIKEKLDRDEENIQKIRESIESHDPAFLEATKTNLNAVKGLVEKLANFGIRIQGI
jgi:hypothetical protein